MNVITLFLGKIFGIIIVRTNDTQNPLSSFIIHIKKAFARLSTKLDKTSYFLLKISVAATIPVAAAVTILPAFPAPSPMK